MSGIDTTKKMAVSVDEAAYLLSISPRKVWLLLERGDLRAAKIGKRTLIPASEMERFLAEAMASGVAPSSPS